MAERLDIAPDLLVSIVAAADADPTRECCGLLVGRGDGEVVVVERVVPAGNHAPDPRVAFEIEPAVLLATHRQARLAGLAVVGWYHSHPDGLPFPSARDAEHADETGKIWLIVARGEARAFESVITGPYEGRFREVALAPIE